MNPQTRVQSVYSMSRMKSFRIKNWTRSHELSKGDCEESLDGTQQSSHSIDGTQQSSQSSHLSIDRVKADTVSTLPKRGDLHALVADNKSLCSSESGSSRSMKSSDEASSSPAPDRAMWQAQNKSDKILKTSSDSSRTLKQDEPEPDQGLRRLRRPLLKKYSSFDSSPTTKQDESEPDQGPCRPRRSPLSKLQPFLVKKSPERSIEYVSAQGGQLLQEIRDALVIQKKVVVELNKAIRKSLDVAKARYVSNNSIGAILSMKKLKRTEYELKSVMILIDYLQSQEIHLLTIIEEVKEVNEVRLLGIPSDQICFSMEVEISQLCSGYKEGVMNCLSAQDPYAMNVCADDLLAELKTFTTVSR